MKWLFVMKDHFSRLVYAVPLPSKSPQHVARELRHIFSVLGYPLIWHTDNGKEFGQAVLDAVKEYNPLAYTLTGACRTPRHQGSVENANGGIKSIIGSMISDKKLILRDRPHLSKAQRKRLEDVSWVTEYPNAVQSLNSAIRSGKNEVEPYSLVFGMRYEDPIMSGLYINPDSKNHQSISERAAFLGGDYESKMRMMKEVGYHEGEDLDQDNPHKHHHVVEENDNDNMGIAEHDSVKMNLFCDDDDVQGQSVESNLVARRSPVVDEVLFQDSKPLSVTKVSSKSWFSPNDPFNDSSDLNNLNRSVVGSSPKHNFRLKDPPQYVPSPSSPLDGYQSGDCPSDSPSALATADWFRQNSEPCQPCQPCKPEMHNNGTSLVTASESIGNKTVSTNHPISVEDAFILATIKNKHRKGDVLIVLPSLWCIKCFSLKSPPFTLISAFPDKYLSSLKVSTDWFRTDFIAAFCRLLAHEYHSSGIMLLDCLYPNQEITLRDCIDIPVGVKKLVVYSNASRHFGLLVFDLEGSKSVTIFDGSNYPNSNWKDHLHWALRITKLVEINTSTRRCLNFVSPGTPFQQRSGKQDDHKWTVSISPNSLKQKDGYNCGPIVCLHAWEILSSGLFSAKSLEYKEYRETVVNKYSFLLDKFSGSLLIRNTPDFIDLAGDGDNFDSDRTTSHPKLHNVDESEESDGDDSRMSRNTSSCQICFCFLEKEFITLDCCNQEVHKHCIVHWASTGSSCPWCRSTLPEDIKTMGEKRTLPVPSQTLDSLTHAMPDFMRAVNPFGRRIFICHDSDESSGTGANANRRSGTCMLTGSRLGPSMLIGSRLGPSASPGSSPDGLGDTSKSLTDSNKKRLSASVATLALSDTEVDPLLAFDPFQRQMGKSVMMEVRKIKTASPSNKRLVVGTPDNCAKRARKEPPEDSKPAAKKTTEELVRDVHDQLKDQSAEGIDAVLESAEKRRRRMINEASGRKRQDEQAKKMKSQYSKSLVEVKSGDAVSLRVMPNQRARGNRGIMAIVVDVSKSNTVRVVTEHGIISGNHSRDYWFSPDWYNVRNSNSPLWGKLVGYQKSIKDGTFVHANYPRLILSRCHQKIYGGQVGRSKCGCKKGCNAGCSCRKAGLPCGSNCKCMANCDYAQTYEIKTTATKNTRKPAAKTIFSKKKPPKK
jgi:hypothetical protein